MIIKWDDVYSNDEVTKAVLHFAKKCLFMRYKALNVSWDEENVFSFMKESEKRISKICANLSGPVEEIVPQPYLLKEIKIKSKVRRLHIATWNDKVIDATLNRMLAKGTAKWLSKNAYAFRNKQNSLDVCQRKIRSCLVTHKYVIKRDIRSFYDSINHEKMLNTLRNICDDRLYDVLKSRVKFLYTLDNPGNTKEATIGLSFGSSLAPILSNILLTPLDRELEKINNVTVFRYADDVLILSTNPSDALSAAKVFDDGIAELGLILKPAASINMSFVECAGFNYVKYFKHLGLQFHDDGSIRLASEKIHKIMNIFRFAFSKKKKQLSYINNIDGKLKLLIQIANDELARMRPMAIIDYYMKHTTDENQYRQLDLWLAEEIISIALGTGHKKGNFKKIPFKKLRDLNLMSLVHRRRLLHHGQIDDSFAMIRNRYLIKKSG